jgi:hypothetical protein
MDKLKLDYAVGQIFEGAHSDAAAHGEWDLEDAIDFVIEHLLMGHFEWNVRARGPKPKFEDHEYLESEVRQILRKHY